MSYFGTERLWDKAGQKLPSRIVYLPMNKNSYEKEIVCKGHLGGTMLVFFSLFFLLLHSALVFNVKKDSYDSIKKIKWNSVRQEREKTKTKEYKN